MSIYSTGARNTTTASCCAPTLITMEYLLPSTTTCGFSTNFPCCTRRMACLERPDCCEPPLHTRRQNHDMVHRHTHKATTHHRYRFEQSVQARVPRWKLNPQGAACHGPYPDPNSRRRWFRDTGERAVPGLRRSWGARCRHCGYRRLRQRHGLGKTRHVGSAAHVHVKHVGATGGCTRVAQRPGRPDIPCQPICLLTNDTIAAVPAIVRSPHHLVTSSVPQGCSGALHTSTSTIRTGTGTGTRADPTSSTRTGHTHQPGAVVTRRSLSFPRHGSGCLSRCHVAYACSAATGGVAA